MELESYNRLKGSFSDADRSKRIHRSVQTPTPNSEIDKWTNFAFGFGLDTGAFNGPGLCEDTKGLRKNQIIDFGKIDTRISKCRRQKHLIFHATKKT